MKKQNTANLLQRAAILLVAAISIAISFTIAHFATDITLLKQILDDKIESEFLYHTLSIISITLSLKSFVVF